ncbi:MAG: hypothetical protein JWQ71_4196 [Pedosphaera sp.]|nr:hypothetical protein [Pedosphaera sp.]
MKMKIPFFALLGTTLLLATLTVKGQSAPNIIWQRTATNIFANDAVAVSPNGQSVASQGTNGVQVWRVSDGVPTHALSLSGSSWFGALAFSPSGGYLVGGDGNSNISLWQTTNWTLVSGMVTRQQGPPVVFLPDSSAIAIGSGTNIEIRTLPKYGLVRSWKAANIQIAALAISPDGTKLASGSDYRNLDSTVKIWEVATGNLLRSIPTAQTYNVGCIAFSPDGTKFATGANS